MEECQAKLTQDKRWQAGKNAKMLQFCATVGLVAFYGYKSERMCFGYFNEDEPASVFSFICILVILLTGWTGHRR
jgi:hypothetical protein